MMKLNKYKFNLISVTTVMLFVFGFVFNFSQSYSQEILNLKQNSIFFINQGAIVQVNGGVNINSSATLTQSAIANSRFYLNGNFSQNGTFNAGVGQVIFNYSTTTEITSGSSITFNEIIIDRANPTDQVIFKTNFTSVLDTIKIGVLVAGSGSDITMSVTGNLVINANGNISTQTGSNTHNLNLSSNLIINDGSLDMINGGSRVNINFIGSGNVSISGSQASGTVNFADVILNKTNTTDTLSLLRGFSSPSATGFLVITRGTLNFGGTESITGALFKSTSNLITFSSNARLILNNPNVNITGQNSDVLFDGTRVTVNSGTFNVGNGSLFYNNGTIFTQNGGTVNIGKSFARDLSNDFANVTFSLFNGVFSVGGDRSDLSTRAVFDLGGAASSFNMSGGEIRLLKNSSAFSGADFLVTCNNGTVTNGTVFFAPNSNINGENAFRINTTRQLHNLTMLDNSGAATPQLEQITNTLIINNNLILAGRGFVQSASTLELRGNLTNNATTDPRFDPKTNTVLLSGTTSTTIGGSVDSLRFHNLHIQKSSLLNVTSNKPIFMSRNLRLIGNNLLIMGDNNLRLDTLASIYASNALSDTLRTTTNWDGPNNNFSSTKHIQFNGSLTSGKIIRNIPIVLPSFSYFRFPFGTPNGFSSFYIALRKSLTTVASGGQIEVLPIQTQHPDITEPGVALKKYFKINSNNITLLENAYNIKMEFLSSNEIQGNINTYDNVFFRTGGNWYDNPGEGYGKVELGAGVYSFEITDVNFDFLNGDWTAGPRSAVEAIYFSIANGPWDSVGTWSRIGYGQTPTTSFPQSNLDLVYIGDGKTVTLDTINNDVRGVYVQNTGRLNILSGAYIKPALDDKDTLTVEAGGTLGIGDPSGITEVADAGNVRNSTRIFSAQGKYVYNGTTNQVTGDGLPNQIGALILENTGTTDSTLTLTRSIEIKDSLVINSGRLNIVTTSCDGETPNRTLIMRGGELLCATFPTKYSIPTFTAGTINFGGTSSFTIPSSGNASTPVNQYYNLKISANVSSNSNITLDPTGEIRITKDFDISQLVFDPIPVSQRFLNSGSTVHFNGSGNQIIPSGYASATALVYRLNYDNIRISGGGVKTLGNPNDLTGINGSNNFVDVNGNVLINSATLKTDNHYMRIRKNFNLSPGALFIADTSKFLFNTSGSTNVITSNGAEFYNLEVEDNSVSGVLEFADNAVINKNFTVNTSKIRTTTQTITLKGDFIQNGILDLGTGTVNFTGTAAQNLIYTGSGNFYNVSTNKTSNHVIVSGTNNIIITNQLTLTQGNFGGRPTKKAIQVNGTISRPGITPGHVDGPLRFNFGIGAVANKLFPIGLGSDYNPFEIELTGGGGTAGTLEANVDSALVFGDVDETILESGKPNGAELSSLQNVPKRWEITGNIPSNTFALGSRKYNARFNFNSNDIRGGANTAFFEVSQRNGDVNSSGWLSTNTGIRTGSSVSILNNEILPSTIKQFFYTGIPANLTFYSVGSGNWSNASIWSTASYGSVDLAPRAPGASDNVRIGDGKSVTLDVPHTVNASKTITVEKAGSSDLGGYLNLGNNIISGAGTFTLANEGAIGIGSADGITTVGATGNIQTTTRNYNPSSHNNAHFIYNGTGAQVTGDGFPLTVKTLNIDKPSGALTITGTSPIPLYVTDSLFFNSGTLNTSTVIIKLGGNFRINNSFTWTPGTTYNGSTGSGTGLALADTTTQPGGFIFNGVGNQYVWRVGETDATFLIFNRFSLSKVTGEIISNTNIESRQVFFHPRNRTNLNLRLFNKKLIVHAADNNFAVHRPGPSPGDANTASRDSLSVSTYGWINGRIIRLLGTSNDRIFPIGTNDRYTPGRLITNSGASGFLEFQALDGNYAQFNQLQINKNTNVQKHWEISRPTNIPYTPLFSFGTGGTLSPRLFFTQNEPRGGVDPSATYTMFRYDLSNNWDNTSSIALQSRQSLQTFSSLNVGTILNDALFNIASTSDPLTNAIVLMVGEAGEGTERVFYSRQNGNWRDSTTWSSLAYGSNTNIYNDFPKLATDIVNIGAFNGVGHRVVLDSALITVSSVDIDTVNGSYGILSVPGENILSGRQFVLKYGSELEIGSVNGILTKILNPLTPSFNDYTFGQTSVTYSPISGGTTHVVGNSVNDFTSSSDIAIGFPFKYLNVDYTNVRLNFDGFIGLGSSVSSVTSLPISTVAGSEPRIVPLGMNLFATGSTVVRSQMTGSAPSRVFTMQWENVLPLAQSLNQNTFTSSSVTYTPITGGTVHVTGNGTADNVTSLAAIPLTFTFNLEGTDFTDVRLNFDGFIGMGTTVSTGLTLPISSAIGSEIRVAPLGVNLFRRSNTIVRSEVTGSAPNRVFTMQWENVFPYATQLFNEYNFTNTTATYSPITGGTLRVNGTGANDTIINNIPIGFNFRFRDSTFSNISINYDGYIAFGSSVTSNTGNPISGISSNYAVSALGFESGSLSRKSTTRLRTELIGTSPNREFVIQWLDASHSSSATASFNFQIRLFENNNSIAISYDTFSYPSGTSTDVQVGLRGASNGTNEVASLNGNVWDGTLANSNSSQNVRFRTTVLPSSGRRFQWTPNNPGYNFQVQLEETTNNIKFNYGTFTHPSGFAAVTSQIGLRGTTNATFNNRATTTNWSGTTAGGANTSTVTSSNTVLPSSGQRYEWSPPTGYNFQVQLVEGGEIRFNYGPMTHYGTAVTPQVGLRGTTSSSFSNRTTTTNWSATTTGGANTSTVTLSTTVFPTSGQRYTWTPPDWSIYNPLDAFGNIQTSLIRNYNFNNFNKGRFVYIGNSNQVTGNGLPSTVAKLEVKNTGVLNNNIVTLSNNLLITDTLKLSNGLLKLPNSSLGFQLSGHLQNNSSPNAITAFDNTHNFTFVGDSLIQNITGSVDSTIFDMKLRFDKNQGDISITGHNVRFNEEISFVKDNKLRVADNRVLTSGPNSTYSTSNGNFSINRMVMVSGNSTAGRVRKEFLTGTNVDRQFTFPIGENSLGNNSRRYNETFFAMKNMTFNANNKVNLDLRSTYPHPNAPSGSTDMLKTYWSFSSSDIVRGTGTTDIELTYNDSSIVGNRVKYLPTAYRRAATGVLPGWSFILDNPTEAIVDTVNRKIIVRGANRLIDHDWFAADPTQFSIGRQFWSRSTGNWSRTATWTNDETNKYTSLDTALNVPGYFPNDTVYISGGHIVKYDTTVANPINFVYVNDNNLLTGELQFASVNNANAAKVLSINKDLVLGTNGLVSKEDIAGPSRDTLSIGRDIQNLALNAGRGFELFRNSNVFTTIKFIGSDSSIINGGGRFENLGTLIMNKSSGINALINNSSTFSSGFSNSINTNPAVDMILKAGSFVQNTPTSLTITNDGDGNLILESNVRLVVNTGTIIIEDGLICGQDSKVLLNNGNLYVGNDLSENMQYESITEIRVQNSSNLRVAGNLRRRFVPSAASIYFENNCLIELMNVGSVTNIANDQRRAAFDIGEATSIFQMTGGTLKIYRPMRSTSGIKDPDILINANETSSFINAGTVQIGDVGVLDVPLSGGVFDKMSILSTLQFHNLTFDTTYARDLDFSTGEIKVRNNFLIKSGSSVSLNGQNLTVGGNFTVEGNGGFKTGTVGTRQVKLNGTTDQNLRIENTLFNDTFGGFWDFIVDKTGGDVILPSDAVGSDLFVRNSLQFSSNNLAKILANGTRFVKSGESVAVPGNVQRFGNGWIVGELRKWINTGAISVLYPVGTTTRYTPATVTTTGGVTGTPGYLNVKPFGITPPDVPDSLLMEQTTYIERYWNVVPNSTEPFALGAGRTYTLTLQYVKGNAPAGDLRNGATFGLFEIFRRDPIFGSAGTWFQHSTINKTDSSTSTQNLSAFGSFIIGESAGETFYSLVSGIWDEPANWSKEGYGGAPEVDDYPKQAGDIVRIGDGKSIIMDKAFNRNLKSVIVESYEGRLGKLSIVDGSYIRSLIFQLRDSCTLETDDNFGFTRLGGQSQNIGAVRATVSRIYGKSRYEYIGSQTMSVGDGLPDEIFTIVVNNSGINNNQVNLSSNTIKVVDTVRIDDGKFSLLNREMNLQGQLVMEEDTEIQYGTGNFRVSGTQNQVLRLNNEEMAVYNMLVDKSAGSVVIDGNNADSRVVVKNSLRFTDSNQVNIDVRSTDRLLVLDSNASVTRLGNGFVDGRVRVWFPSGSSTKLFPIGVDNNYMYANIESNSTINDTIKYVEGIVLQNPPIQPFVGNRLDVDSRLNYYWSLVPLDSVDTQISTRSFKTKFRVPNAYITNFDITNSVIRRRSLFAEVGEWSERRYNDLIWNTDTSTVRFNLTATPFAGLGEFFIGEKAKRVFYSKASGDWTNNNTWSFSADGSILVPAGIYPNSDWEMSSEYNTEVRDSVIIDDFNRNPVIVTLNTQPKLAYLNLNGNSKLIMSDTTFISGSSYGVSIADFTGGIIENKTPLGINNDLNISLFRFNSQPIFAPEINFIFSGDEKQILGDAFPPTVNGLTFDNTGDPLIGDNIIVLPNYTLNITNFNILNGDIRPLNSNSDLRISGNMTLNQFFDFTRDENNNPTCPKLTFTGSGINNQVISGDTSIKVCEISMDRGAGDGIVSTQLKIEVTSFIDLQEGANTNQQIFQIGNDGELFVTNSNPTTSILDYSSTGPLRYIQTTPTGGSLIRNIVDNSTYIYPVGSFENSLFLPAFATFTGGNGTAGKMGVRSSSGQNLDFERGHNNLSFGATDYIGRYWAIDSITHNITGQFRYEYNDADIINQENDINTVGKWSLPKETGGGTWTKLTTGLNLPSNYFETPANLDVAGLRGDWTIGNFEAFMRIFYSRLSGNWSNDQSWTLSPTHSGPIVGTGIAPVLLGDSVVIAGGVNGIDNHIINLDIPTVGVTGVQVGGDSKTGTLILNDNLIQGVNFTLLPLSTLTIGHPNGIVSTGDFGNIQNTGTRSFSDEAIYIYNGNTNQVTGSGLPAQVNSLKIENTGLVNDNTVILTNNVTVLDSMYISDGIFDINNKTIISDIDGNGEFKLFNNAQLTIGGTNSIGFAVANYNNYLVEDESTIEFNGTNQSVSTLPASLNTVGIGNLIIRNAGTKLVEAPMLVKGTLNVLNGSTLEISPGIDSMKILKNSCIDGSIIDLYGVMEVGEQ